nr:zinc-binding dehydrogenase [Micromonospora sp. DSM 115978]
IIAVDTNPLKEKIAREFGATDVIVPEPGQDTVGAVKAVLPAGVDYAFECVGHPALIRASLDMLDWGGSAVVLGVPPATAEVPILVAGMYLDKSLLGCRYGSSRPQRDVRTYVDLYRSGRLMLDELVTRTYPLAELASAMHDLERGELARGVLLVS